MHKRINKIGLILVIGLGMASSTLLAGDEDTEASENMLPEFELPPYVAVVTRTPLPLDKVSPSVSYISEAEMIQNQDRSIVDVLARQPGVIINTSGTKGGLSSLFMRGTNSDHTGFFLDGRRLNPGFSNQFDLEFLSIDNLSSVEVQRGASSVNYGSAGIGGV
ncbi:MAG: vitamin B12 transporter, partial [Lentimonas sp.]